MVVRDKIKEGLTVIEYMSIEAMIVDLLTKGLTPKLFKEHVFSKGVLTFSYILASVINVCNDFYLIHRVSCGKLL